MKYLRLIHGVTLQEAVQIRDEITEAQTLADKRTIQLIRLFATIEDYSTRVIYTAIGVDTSCVEWKQNHSVFRDRLSRIFSAHERFDILRELLKDGSLNERFDHKVAMPSDFNCEPKSFFNALQIAFEYRNSLVHNGYMTFVGRLKGRIVPEPSILARPHHLEQGYPHVILNQSLVVKGQFTMPRFFLLTPNVIPADSPQNEVYPFVEFVHSLSNEFTGGIFGTQRFGFEKNKSPMELFEHRKSKIKSTSESFLRSKVKKLDALLSDLVDRELIK